MLQGLSAMMRMSVAACTCLLGSSAGQWPVFVEWVGCSVDKWQQKDGRYQQQQLTTGTVVCGINGMI